MRKIIVLIISFLYLLNISKAVETTAPNGINNMTFIENKGQLADTKGKLLPEIKFYTQAPGVNLYFKDNSIEFNFVRFEKKTEDELTDVERHELSLGNKAAVLDKMYIFRIDLEILGTNPNVNITATDIGSVQRNYYLSHCPDGILNLPEYKEITYNNIYNNINLRFYFENGQLKYDFIVLPGGNPEDIRIKYNGITDFTIDENGNIKMKSEICDLFEKAPYTFSPYNNQRVESRFENLHDTIMFKVGDYNKNQTLIIDPVVHWATYYNNAYSSDTWTRPVFGSDGSLFNVCYTYATTYTIINPGSGAWIDNAIEGSIDLVIVKFDPSHALVWATYYGGNGSDIVAGHTDYGKSIAIDGNNNLFVGGFCNNGATTFPTYDPGGGAFYQSQTKIYGETSFMLKFNSSGQRLWATIFQHENANTNWSSIRLNGIAAKGSKVYFTGQTYRSNNNDIPLRTLSGAYNNSTYVGDQDAFVGRFSSDGVLEWCTYLNSGNTSLKAYSQGCDVAVDNNGNLFYIGRESYNSGNKKHYLLNPGGAYYQDVCAGDQDITITRFNSSMAITWSTYYGGTLQDIPSMIETDKLGNAVIVCRAVRSTNFPTYNPGLSAYYQSSKAANGTASDAGIMKFSSTGVRQWATYYGGGGTYVSGGSTYDAETLLSGVGFDNSNNIYFTGSTQSPLFPTQNESGSYFSGTRNGESDAVFLKFDNNGVRQWATYYGGSGNEGLYSGKGAVGNLNCETAIVAFGYTNSTDFPTVNPGSGGFYESTAATANCNVIFYFAEPAGSFSTSPTSASANPTSFCSGNSVNLTVNGGSLGSGASWHWYSGSCGGTPVGTGSSINVSPTGTTTYYVRAEGDCNITSCASVTVTLNTNSVAPISLTATPSSICSGSSTITVNGGSLGTGAVWQLYTGSCGGTLVGSNSTGSFSVSPTSTTTYYIRASGTCNTTSCQSVTVTVSAPSVAPTSLTATPSSICSGSSTITVNGGSLGT
ncbi:MAG: hypothetical protein PHT69_15235, partial [Bacteroidales bacterium]|nr:hypothetical protein [Bacteroidales bacterium]